MAEKTKLQLQIEAAQKKIQEEQRRLKTLEKQQSERERKDRNHRLCKRHGLIEKMLPDTIALTDEQFEAFVKQHIASHHGLRALANLTAKNNGENAPAEAKQNRNFRENAEGATA